MGYSKCWCWGWSKRYYLLHPWIWIKDLFYNCKYAYQRVMRGWSDADAFNLNYWLADILPNMLRYLADDISYPGQGEFDTWEKWHNWLVETAANVERLRENAIENEWDERFYEESERLRRTKHENGAYIFFYEETPEYKVLKDKWFARAKEIGEYQVGLAARTFAEIGKNFYDLWS